MALILALASITSAETSTQSTVRAPIACEPACDSESICVVGEGRTLCMPIALLREPDATVTEEFAQPGQWMFEAGFGGGISYYGLGSDTDWAIAIRLAPSLGYFLVQNFALTAHFWLYHSFGALGGSGTTLGSGGGLGYNVYLSKSFSFFPQLAATYVYTDSAATPSGDAHYLDTSASARLLFHPVPHLFFGAGLRFLLLHALSSESQISATRDPTIDVVLSIGGWF